METIKNYLDTMFANLPNTPAVVKAKDELWQMMEDKYTELISEGRTENDAVGTVISEFGNLNDLAEALGLEDIVISENRENKANESEVINQPGFDSESSNTFNSTVNTPDLITASEAEEMLKERSLSSNRISLGIALCIMSISMQILGGIVFNGAFEFVGFILFIGMIAGGILMIIFGALEEKSWKKLSEGNYTLSMDATKYVAEERSLYSRNHNLLLTGGILLCVLCWIPTMIFSEILPKYEDASAIGLFITAGLGVFLIVYSSLRMNGYDKLLKLNGEGTLKAAYEPENDKNVRYISPVADFFMSVYWPTLTCLYLILSFLTFHWEATWAIWPVAGILYGPLKKALREKKQ
jgi:hypothetical protein